MRIVVKLYATLGPWRPGVPAGAPSEVDVPGGATVEALLGQLGVPVTEAKAIFVNGRARPLDWPLQPGDQVGVFPPIGGG